MNSMDTEKLLSILEAALLAAGRPLNVDQITKLFDHERDGVDRDRIRECLDTLQQRCKNRGYELKQVASGYRLQVRQDLESWISRLWEEKPPRYSRALLETLALIVYRQPITRAEIEEVRGVSVSSNIIKTLLEREWVRILGHKEVPGRPALYGTTRKFLDYFNLKSLDELPSLADLKNLDEIQPQLALNRPQREPSEPINEVIPEVEEKPQQPIHSDSFVIAIPGSEVPH